MEEAIKAYTIDAAYHLRWDDIIGSLEAGKRADIIVLDRNLFESTTDEIAEANVLLTMMNGKIVHEEAVGWDEPYVSGSRATKPVKRDLRWPRRGDLSKRRTGSGKTSSQAVHRTGP